MKLCVSLPAVFSDAALYTYCSSIAIQASRLLISRRSNIAILSEEGSLFHQLRNHSRLSLLTNSHDRFQLAIL